MYSRNLFYLVYIALLFTIVYGFTKNEVLNLISYDQFYCKGDLCVSTSDRTDFDTIDFPNNDGTNTTYITNTCSLLDIDLDLCISKNCTSDSQCLTQ